MEIKSYVNLEGNKIERLMPNDGSADKFFGVAQAVNNGTPFEVRFPIEAVDLDAAMKEFDNALSQFIKNVESARAQANANKSAQDVSSVNENADSAPKLVLNNG